MFPLRIAVIAGGMVLLLSALVCLHPVSAPAGPVMYQGRGYAVSWIKDLGISEKEVKIKPLEKSSPTYHEGMIYVGTSVGKFLALKADSGIKIWEFDSQGPIESEAVYHENAVFFGDSKGIFYALEAKSGKLIWSYKTGGVIFARPVVSGDQIIVFNSENRLFSLGKFRGEVLWIKSIEGETSSSEEVIHGSSCPVLYDGKIFVGTSNGSLVCLSLSGEILWEQSLTREIGYRDIDATPTFLQKTMIIPGSNGKTYGIKPENGEIQWQAPGGGNTSGMIDNNNELVCIPVSDITIDRGEVLKISCFEPGNGNEVWKSVDIKSIDPGKNYGWNPAMPVFAGGKIIIGLSGLGIVIINRNNGKIEGFLPISSGISSNPAKTGENEVIFISNDGYLYKLLIL